VNENLGLVPKKVDLDQNELNLEIPLFAFQVQVINSFPQSKIGSDQIHITLFRFTCSKWVYVSQ